ncbi:MAG: hypothetical protein II990_03985 [Muribaculaceae bacterium]|nr:hypothetical protein [Muribaculaceae bacterium]MBQ3605394.1 hypothetical protein [Muribaculaceae bacterium]
MKKLYSFFAIFTLTAVSAFGATDYGLTVGGVDVTSDNCSNITGEHIEKHSSATDDEYYIKYDPATKTLTFKNILIERTGSYNRAILNEDVDGLKIVFLGKNELSAEDSSPVRLNNNTTITVPEGGELDVHGGDEDGITVGNGKTLIFDNVYDCSVSTSNSNAIEGATGKENLIVRNNSCVIAFAQSENHNGVYDFASLTVSDSYFNVVGYAYAIEKLGSFTHEGAYPIVMGAVYNAEKKRFGAFQTQIAVGVCRTDETVFPDANFRQALYEFAKNPSSGIVEGLPYNYYTYPVGAYTGYIKEWRKMDLAGKSIANLKGIEHFYNLQTLICNDNQLTSVDLTKNVNLSTLNLSNNSLSTIDLSKNKELNTLALRNNKLESLDIINNSSLEYLYVNNNLLTGINLGANWMLKYLDINDNKLNTLDLSYADYMKEVNCQNNKLTEISVGNIARLNCSNNNLTGLKFDAYSGANFKYLNCSDNAINGANVQQFVDKLPTPSASNNAELVFKSSSDTEKNSMSQEQAITVMGKNWTLKHTNGNIYLGEAGVEGVEVDPIDDNAPRYNLNGQPVDDNYRGIVIQKGKKILVK